MKLLIDQNLSYRLEMLISQGVPVWDAGMYDVRNTMYEMGEFAYMQIRGFGGETAHYTRDETGGFTAVLLRSAYTDPVETPISSRLKVGVSPGVLCVGPCPTLVYAALTGLGCRQM